MRDRLLAGQRAGALVPMFMWVLLVFLSTTRAADVVNCPLNCTGSSPLCFHGTAVVAPGLAVPERVRIGFVGDQGINSNAAAVLAMVRGEGVSAIIHAGDFAYTQGTPAMWDLQINASFAPTFPYLAVTGNHDVNADWTLAQSQTAVLTRLAPVPVCTGYTATSMACTLFNITFALVSPGLVGPLPVEFVRWAFTKYPSRVRVCAWHLNQRKMQAGSKADETGYQIYDECRRWGAIVATGHEHSYARTWTMRNFAAQSVASTNAAEPLVVRDGTDDVATSFAFVSGVSGHSLRALDATLGVAPWWAKAIGTNSPVPINHGALICEFVGVNGTCWFKQIDGAVRDNFTFYSDLAPQTAPDPSAPALHRWQVASSSQVVSQVGTDAASCIGGAAFAIAPAPTTSVAIQLADVTLPAGRGAGVVSAFVRFVTGSFASGASTLSTRVELGSSAALACGVDTLSARTLSAAVSQTAVAWTDLYEEQRLNVTTLVRQAIDAPAWVSGARMTFVVTGTGVRYARGLSPFVCYAPQLEVVFDPNSPPSNPPPPPGGVASSSGKSRSNNETAARAVGIALVVIIVVSVLAAVLYIVRRRRRVRKEANHATVAESGLATRTGKGAADDAARRASGANIAKSASDASLTKNAREFKDPSGSSQSDSETASGSSYRDLDIALDDVAASTRSAKPNPDKATDAPAFGAPSAAAAGVAAPSIDQWDDDVADVRARHRERQTLQQRNASATE